jgi:glycosyltransferase involved in cell wall biosynthesis
MLMRAFSLVRRRRPARLAIIGDGPECNALHCLAQSLGIEKDLWMPGEIDNPFRYMARAGVFVLSSAWEGFPNVLLEAIASGCPTTSTDCESGPRELLDGGAYGRLVPVGDAEAMAAAITDQLIARHDLDRLRHWARRFSIQAVADRYLQIFDAAPVTAHDAHRKHMGGR